MQHLQLTLILFIGLLAGCKGSKQIGTAPPSPVQNDQEFPFMGRPGPASIDGMFVEASTFLIRGDFNSAEVEFQKILAIDPAHAATNYNLAKINLQNRKFSEALEYIRPALTSDPQNIWYKRTQVEIYERQGNLRKALEAQEAIHQLTPNNREEWEKMATLQFRLGQKEQALTTLEKISNELGETPGSLITKYEWLAETRKYPAAAAAASELLEIDPVNPQWRNMYFNALVKSGEIEAADQSLQEWIKLDPQSAQAQLLLSESFGRTGNSEQSQAYLIQAFQNPEMDESWKSRYIEEQMASPEKDERLLSSLVQAMKVAHPGSTVANAFQARLMISEQPTENIRPLLKEALVSDPGSLKTWKQLLDLSFSSGRYDYLYTDSRDAREMFPNEESILFYYGISAAAQGQYAKAQRVLTKIELIEPEDKLLLARSLSESARISLILEEQEESKRLLTKALSLADGDEFVKSREAWIHASQGDSDNTTIRSARTFMRDNDNPAGQALYAIVSWKSGNESEALTYIRKATTNTEVAEWLVLLGDIELANGDKEAARAAFVRARNAGADINPELRLQNP